MSSFDDEEYESFDVDPLDDDDDESDLDDADDDDADDDDDEADDDEDDDEDEDDLEDATDDEIDFVLAAYREDGVVQVQALRKDLANDLEELVAQLRRLPADAGALGFVSLEGEVLVLARVRGQHVQALLSDAAAAADWPIARDVADLLGADVPEEDDDPEPMGDLGILADLGVSEFDLGGLLDENEFDSGRIALQLGRQLNLGADFRRVVETALPD